ncbi:MAG TPA: polysaccharide pyruvyl transferase family protein, partial [Bryobacteraceae bacterium]|nr:polysaccharide pyruvyl transferase family protein [Bryobacteraceae bacterium]
MNTNDVPLGPLHILCCSTRQWNPGDEWIALGVRELFARIYDYRPLNWILYDRSPDSFVEPWECPSRRPGLLGNSYQPQAGGEVFHLAIAAGTPEWRGPHFESVFRSTRPTPWMFLGVDHVHDEPIQPTDEELSILRTASVVTRGALGAEALSRLGVSSHTLPCPSLFAAKWERPTRQLARVGVVLQSDAIQNQSVPTPLKTASIRLVRDLNKHYQVTVFCNYIDEFRAFRSTLDVPVRYSYDSAEYMDMMSDCDVIVSTRLHSAFLANSLLKPAIVMNDSSRVQSAAALYPYVFPLEPQTVLPFLQQLDVQLVGRQLFNWKRVQEDRYKNLLIE